MFVTLWQIYFLQCCLPFDGCPHEVESLLWILRRNYFLQCGSPFDIRTLGFVLLLAYVTLKLFRLSRKPAPSVNGGTWGFLSSFCVFFLSLCWLFLNSPLRQRLMSWPGVGCWSRCRHVPAKEGPDGLRLQVGWLAHHPLVFAIRYKVYVLTV